MLRGPWGVGKTNYSIHWLVSYPLDSVIHPLNYWGLVLRNRRWNVQYFRVISSNQNLSQALWGTLKAMAQIHSLCCLATSGTNSANSVSSPEAGGHRQLELIEKKHILVGNLHSFRIRWLGVFLVAFAWDPCALQELASHPEGSVKLKYGIKHILVG